MATRICNESCADFAFTSMISLISQLTSTSKLNEDKIYDSWNGLFYTLAFSLEENFYQEGNTFELISSMKISTITSFVLGFNTVSYKALDGFTLTEIAESIMTQTLIHNGLQKQSGSSGGIMGTIGNIFGGRKGKNDS